MRTNGWIRLSSLEIAEFSGDVVESPHLDGPLYITPANISDITQIGREKAWVLLRRIQPPATFPDGKMTPTKPRWDFIAVDAGPDL